MRAYIWKLSPRDPEDPREKVISSTWEVTPSTVTAAGRWQQSWLLVDRHEHMHLFMLEFPVDSSQMEQERQERVKTNPRVIRFRN